MESTNHFWIIQLLEVKPDSWLGWFPWFLKACLESHHHHVVVASSIRPWECSGSGSFNTWAEPFLHQEQIAVIFSLNICNSISIACLSSHIINIRNIYTVTTIGFAAVFRGKELLLFILLRIYNYVLVCVFVPTVPQECCHTWLTDPFQFSECGCFWQGQTYTVGETWNLPDFPCVNCTCQINDAVSVWLLLASIN